MPVPPRALAAFVDDMAERLRPATIETYVQAVNRIHRDLDLPLPAGAGVVVLALRRMRRTAAEKGLRQKQAAPMRRSHIDAALARMGSRLIDLRDAALVSLAYDTLCRASELVALNVGDVREHGHDAVAYVARSKTDQEGDGDFRLVARDTYARVRAWVETAGLKADEPLFMPMSRNDRGERLTRRDVARIYQRRVGEAFSAHSTRVGAAIEQREAGVPTGLIAQTGGWKGDAMPARYTRHIAAQESGAAILARQQGRA
jgi:integrase